MRKKLILGVLILLPLIIQAQPKSNRRGLSSEQERRMAMEVGSNAGKDNGIVSEEQVNQDSTYVRMGMQTFPSMKGLYSECYREVTNQNGRWKGVGKPLSEAEQKHVNVYFRLLRKEGAGSNAPFTYMQVVDAYGKLTTDHRYGPILANPFTDSDEMPFTWWWKLSDMCQFERLFVNGEMVQENFYDADGKLLLQYHATRVDKEYIIGHYTDAYGNLAVLRDDNNIVGLKIRLDSNGYESEYWYLDKYGRPVRNSDDAFVMLRTHDKEGHLMAHGSGDIYGRPMIDNCGNFGYRYIINKKGWNDTAICIDNQGRPMRMPDQKDNSSVNVCKTHYTYDRYGRVLSQSYYDCDGNKDTVKGGEHCYYFTYNSYGEMTSLRAVDLNGQLMSFWQKEYDNKGELIFSVYRDKDSLFRRNTTCLTRKFFHGEKGYTEWRYTTTDGTDTVLDYRCHTNGVCDTTWDYDDEEIRVTLYDDKGRVISWAYYDLNMHLSTQRSYCKIEYQYFDTIGKRIEVTRIYDAEGLLKDVSAYWGHYNIKVEEYDTINETIITTTYDGNRMLSREGKLYTDGLSNSCGTLFFDTLGMRSRTCQEAPLAYTLKEKKNEQGYITVRSSENEFGEPCYALMGDHDNSTMYCFDVFSDYNYLDERGDTIPRYSSELKEFKNGLKKSFCIELIDSIGFKLGLRSGDLIVKYGDWNYPNPTPYGRHMEILLCYESVMKANEEKEVVVMRHDAATRTSRLIKLTLPQGTPRQLGFVYHMLYMTDKECERYLGTVASQNKTVSLGTTNSENEGDNILNFIVPYKFNNDTNYNKAYRSGFNENAVVLAWLLFSNGESQFLNCFKRHEMQDKFLKQDYDSIILFYTVDGLNAKQYTIIFDSEEGDFFSSVRRSYTSRFEDIDRFTNLAEALEKQYARHEGTVAVRYTPHEAAELLMVLPGIEIQQLDEQRYCGDSLYGKVISAYRVLRDEDEMSYDEWEWSQSIFEHIDYSDYVIVYNEDDFAWFKVKNGKFVEAVWTTGNSIVFLEGDLDLRGKYAVLCTTTGDGQMHERGIEGRYVLLQYNEWKMGMRIPELGEQLEECSDREKQLILAPIEEKDGKITLGRKKKYSFSAGMVGLHFVPQEVSDEVFWKALKMLR